MADTTEHLAKRRRIGDVQRSSFNCNFEAKPLFLGPVTPIDGDISTGGDSGFQDLDDESRAASTALGLLTPSSIDDEPHTSTCPAVAEEYPEIVSVNEDDQPVNTQLIVNCNSSPVSSTTTTTTVFAAAPLPLDEDDLFSERVDSSVSTSPSINPDEPMRQTASKHHPRGHPSNQSHRDDVEAADVDSTDENRNIVPHDDEDENTGAVDSVAEGDDASNISGFSCLSGMSGEDWKPLSHRPMRWLRDQMLKQTITPREVLEHILPNTPISPDWDTIDILRIIFDFFNHPPPKRTKLPTVNLLEDVVTLIRKSSRIVVLTGAGVSVSCGIPDFRSKDGIYARLNKEFPTLPNPQAMFDIYYFRRDPRPFFKFAKEIYPGQFKPSPSHKFIQKLESNGKLLRNYTQNIDTLEQAAGIRRVINCHGSFATATCTRCKYQVEADFIKDDIFQQRIPLCPQCPPDSPDFAVMKPDIVFFGESLPDEFHKSMTVDKDAVDLLIVMGSSLKVNPVSLIPSSLEPNVPQILINREPLSHMGFDVELLGDCDVIVQEILYRLGSSWTDGSSQQPLTQLTVDDINNSGVCSQFPHPQMTLSSEVNFAPDIRCSAGSSSSSGDIFNQSNRDIPSSVHCLPDNSFLFIPPSRYVFKGAELSSLDSHMDSDDSSSSSSSSDSEDEVSNDDEGDEGAERNENEHSGEIV